MPRTNKVAFEALAEALGSMQGKQFETSMDRAVEDENFGYYDDAIELERRLAWRGFKIVKIEQGDDDPMTSVIRSHIYGRSDPRDPRELPHRLVARRYWRQF